MYPDGAFVATAEDEHITIRQFERALEKAYPNHDIAARKGWGEYWRADGKPKA